MATRTLGEPAHALEPLPLEPIAARDAPRLVRAAMRGLGCALIAAVLIPLVGYGATTVFYCASSSWIAPTTLSPHDENVIALVPYAGLANASPGAPVYSCRIAMVLCHRVGHVRAVLPGELTFEHPHRDALVRGRMIEIALDEPSALEHDVLFLGSAPLWL